MYVSNCTWGNKWNTWNLGEKEKGKTNNRFHTRHARRQRRGGDKECLFDFSQESSTTRIRGQQLHLHENPTQDKGGNRGTREKTKEIQAHWQIKREIKRGTGAGIWGQGWVWAAGPALMTVTAATSVAAGTNQRPPRADLAPSPCCARALHSKMLTLSPGKRVPRCEGSAALL